MWFFLSLENINVIVGLLIDPKPIVLCLTELGGPKRGTEMMEGLICGIFRTYTFIDDSLCYI